MTVTPHVGEIVLVNTGMSHNGSYVHAAIVTRAWDFNCVNLMVLPDCEAPYCRTSVLRDSDVVKEPSIHHWIPLDQSL